jgi:mannan polymerase II complex MNN10 subunit
VESNCIRRSRVSLQPRGRALHNSHTQTIIDLTSTSTTSNLDPPPSIITTSHHRRRSSTSIPPLRLVKESQPSHQQQPRDPSWGQGSTSGLPAGPNSVRPTTLTPIPGTPANPLPSPMTLSRSPSPLPGGGWSSPGLTPGSGATSPRYPTTGHGSLSPGAISWASAKAKSDEVRSYPSFSTRNSGFFSRQKRKISASLPRFSLSRDFREQEKLGRGRSSGSSTGWRSRDNSLKGRVVSFVGNAMRRRRFRLLFSLLLGLVLYLNFWSGMSFLQSLSSENSTN